MEMLKKALVLEQLMGQYFQSLAMLVHNGRIRKQCYYFLNQAKLKQVDLVLFLKVTKESEDELPQQDWADGKDNLSIIGVIDSAMETTIEKVRVYKWLMNNSPIEYKQFFRKLLYESIVELKFFRNEKAFQEKSLDPNVKIAIVPY